MQPTLVRCIKHNLPARTYSTHELGALNTTCQQEHTAHMS